MRYFWLSSLTVLAIVLTACSSRSTDDALKQELQTVISWAATAQTAADAWTQGTVPTAYTRQTLQKTQEALRQSADSLKQSQAADPEVLTNIQQIEQEVSQLSEAIAQKDRAKVAQPLQKLSRQAQALKQISERLGGQS